MKINVGTVIVYANKTPIKGEGGRNVYWATMALLHELDTSPEILTKMTEGQQKAIDLLREAVTQNNLTVRECLVTLLQYFNAPGKAMFTQFSAGMKLGDEAVSEVELSKNELETVQGAIEANEAQTDKGAKPIYGSWILGQVLAAIGAEPDSA